MPYPSFLDLQERVAGNGFGVPALQPPVAVELINGDRTWLGGLDLPTACPGGEIGVANVLEFVVVPQLGAEQISVAFNGIVAKKPARPSHVFRIRVTDCVLHDSVDAAEVRMVGHEVVLQILSLIHI